MSKPSLYIFLFFCFLFVLQVRAQQRTFDANRIASQQEQNLMKGQQMEDGALYGTEPLKKGRIDELYGDSKGENSMRESGINGGNMSGIGQLFRFIMYLLAAAILVGVVYFILRNSLGSSGQQLYKEDYAKLSPENIQTLDTKALISQAVEREDYRLAVTIQLCRGTEGYGQEKQNQVETRKTNQDYVEEVSKSPFAKAFETLTYHFDYIWYGNFPIDRVLYDKLAGEFQTFQTKI